MLSAKDVMTKELITVTANTPVLDAISLLLGSGISGLPVVDVEMHVIGIITEMDLLNYLFSDTTKKQCVSDFMTKTVECIDENTTLREVCKRLLESKFIRIPVQSNGELVGIVSRKDILLSILKQNTL